MLFFAAAEGPRGAGLWVSDGTAEGTRSFTVVYPAFSSAFLGGWTPVGDLVFFGSEDFTHGWELWALPLVKPAVLFRRGDCNDDGKVNISDAVWILNWLFRGGAEPGCAAAANANGDGEVSLSDPVALLSYLFLAGPEIPAPFPECGPGTLAADDKLGCATPLASCGAGR